MIRSTRTWGHIKRELIDRCACHTTYKACWQFHTSSGATSPHGLVQLELSSAPCWRHRLPLTLSPTGHVTNAFIC